MNPIQTQIQDVKKEMQELEKKLNVLEEQNRMRIYVEKREKNEKDIIFQIKDAESKFLYHPFMRLDFDNCNEDVKSIKVYVSLADGIKSFEFTREEVKYE